MKKELAIIVTHADEVRGVLRQSPWFGAKAAWICLSIDAYDQCLSLSIPSVEFPEWLQQRATLPASVVLKIFAAMQLVDDAGAEERRFLGFSGESRWNHQYHLELIAVTAAAVLASKLAVDRLDKQRHYLVPQRDNPGDYHFPGVLPAAIMLRELQEAGLSVEGVYLPPNHLNAQYSPSVYDQIPNFWSNEVVRRWESSRRPILYSPAGLFYPSDRKMSSILLDSFGEIDSSWFISPPFWNVNGHGRSWGHSIDLQAAFSQLDDDIQSAAVYLVESMVTTASDALISQLGEKISGYEQFSKQVCRLRQRYLFQVLTFLGLSTLHANRTSAAVVVTALDGGLNGPLHSIADAYGVPCFVLPHSRVVPAAIDGPGIVLTEYWQPRDSKSPDGKANKTIYFPSLESAQQKTECKEEQKSIRITIILNGIHRGISTLLSVQYLRETLNAIKLICASGGADLKVRLKPGDQTPIRAYSELLSLNMADCTENLEKPLDQVLAETDLVVAIGEPSTAVWRGIELGCAALVISDDEPLSYGTNIDEKIISMRSTTEGLSLIRKFVGDPVELHRYRSRQLHQFDTTLRERLRKVPLKAIARPTSSESFRLKSSEIFGQSKSPQ
jgi:hypothetical protein